ncbi:hypothetical protein [Mesonia sp.]|uniref:hypothetical protein n=1 Tax=Mesonia sp. TaxID=1960830 RepID=UPI00175B6310|nr:hypothetical protein [Mesonia sp.]HIB36344.1 hypothetical protein [Mesonia sp.]
MGALEYEYLIRRAHNCGRYGVEGANADEYRALERSSALYATALNEIENNLPRTRRTDIKDLAFNYGKNAGEISTYIRIAIEKVQSDLEGQLNEEEQEELENCKADLNEPTIVQIDGVIERAQAIMIDHKLFPA